jgi:hypothetical protein
MVAVINPLGAEVLALVKDLANEFLCIFVLSVSTYFGDGARVCCQQEDLMTSRRTNCGQTMITIVVSVMGCGGNYEICDEVQYVNIGNCDLNCSTHT